MYRRWIERLGIERYRIERCRIERRLAIALAVLVLTSCATHQDKLLTHDSRTMLDIWTQEAGNTTGGDRATRQLLDARLALRRPLTSTLSTAPTTALATVPATTDRRTPPGPQAHYTRTAANEIYRQFQRLPNPDLVMYVFPHLVGTDPVPVPGYSTVFPFYQRVQYALPGERAEDY